MNTNDLKKYVKKVLDLESSIYMQKEAISNLEANVDILLETEFKPTQRLYKYNLYEMPKISLDSIVFFAVYMLSLFVGFASGVVGRYIYEESAVLINDFGTEVKTGILVGIIVGIVGCIIYYVYKVIEFKRLCKQTKADNTKIMKDTDEINNQIVAYNNQVENENYERKLKIEEELNYLNNQINCIKEVKKQTENTLAQFYEKNIIYPKYRDLIAVASFNDYLMSGVCSELEGHEGCYNKYDIEIRLNTIIYKIDEVLDNLDKIEKNQHSLYIEMKNCSSKLENIMEGMSSVVNEIENLRDQNAMAIETQKNSNAVLEFYAEENARNIDDIKWLNTIETIWK